MLYLSKHDADTIIEHCRNDAPAEACGILAGRDKRVEKVYLMSNADKSSKTFLMEPKEQFKVMKEMRALGLEMVGIYHSHLISEAYPSSHDVEFAYYPDTSYVIASLKDRDNPVIRSFKIIDKNITEEEISIT